MEEPRSLETRGSRGKDDMEGCGLKKIGGGFLLYKSIG
jgi:hypothetical protein